LANSKKHKVVGIGFHKTGTTTLLVALQQLGYKVLGVSKDFLPLILNKDLDLIFDQVKHYNAFQDNPWPLLYKEFDHRYSNCKFILTKRQEQKWIASAVAHFGKNNTDMRKWIYGIGHPEGNESQYLEEYRKHNREVVEYFKNDNSKLLVVDWEEGDGWYELCTFLEEDIPKIAFPHARKRKRSKIDRYINRCLAAIVKYQNK